MDSGLIFPHHRNLSQRDGDEEKACRLKVAGAQADGEATAEPDPSNGPPGKALMHTKVPVPQTDTGG
jgi:hypothetical protein